MTTIVENELSDLILHEDLCNPLTDEDLAVRLNSSRSNITQTRKSLGIPSSRERFRKLLKDEIEHLSDDRQVSERGITKKLNDKGIFVSRACVSGVLKEVREENKNFDFNDFNPIEDDDTDVDAGAGGGDADARIVASTESAVLVDGRDSYEEDENFKIIVGWDGSLISKIEQAKAAVLYPPQGLHTLITGSTGVGKSDLAECMYKFALKNKGLSEQEFPFVIFNCADYAGNPQLLLSQLFGYKKGAFTDAKSDKDGLVAKANGGILFLDEIHRLPSEGQEILYQIIDKNKYRKLGDTEFCHNANLMIIGATTENIEDKLLGSFCRRIPMIIELPDLVDRPINERADIIRMFFRREAMRIDKKIIVNPNVMRALLTCECSGNLGQLLSHIQVSTARAFLSYMSQKDGRDFITVGFSDLPVHIVSSLQDTQLDSSKIEHYLDDDHVFSPNQADEDIYAFSNDFYKNLEEEYYKMAHQGIDEEVINKILSSELEMKAKQIIRRIQRDKQKLQKRDLKTIANPKVVDMVQEMLKIGAFESSDYANTLFYCLVAHLNAFLERAKSGEKSIKNMALDVIKKDNPSEFRIAREMAGISNLYLGIPLPDEEIGFIATYLRSCLFPQNLTSNSIGVVVMTYGHVADGMVAVANQLLGTDLVRSVVFSLDEPLNSAYNKAAAVIKDANRGKGVLLLMDMGSSLNLGHRFTEETGIVTRTISRVDTVMVIDAARRALIPEADIDDIVESLAAEKNIKSVSEKLREDNKKATIISLCLTGEGTAKYIHDMISSEVVKLDPGIEILDVGLLSDEDPIARIDSLRRDREILLIVGTINPHHPELTFYSATSMLKHGDTSDFGRLLAVEYTRRNQEKVIVKDHGTINAIFDEGFLMVDTPIEDKDELLEVMCGMLNDRGRVTKDYLQGVKMHEEISVTALGNGIAIPHGRPEDIIIPTVGVATLKTPIVWSDGMEVSLVLLLALNGDAKNEFPSIFRLLKDNSILKKITGAKSAEEIMKVIKSS